MLYAATRAPHMAKLTVVFLSLLPPVLDSCVLLGELLRGELMLLDVLTMISREATF